MNKKYILSALMCVVAVVFTGCIEENFEKVTPAQDGDEIIFGVRAGFEDSNPSTRTVYSGETYPVGEKTFERIDWVDETDMIEIHSPEAANGSTAHYTINHLKDADQQKDYAYLTRIGDSSLQWNGDGQHNFYAMYPSSKMFTSESTLAQGVKMESMLCQYNLLDRSNEEMIKYVNEKGLGTVAMGPVGGGRLAAPTDLYAKLTGKPSIATYELAFKFCLGNPNLNCALSGMQNLEMVQKNIKVASDDTTFSEEEWTALGVAIEELKKFSELYCTGCKYCQPCPVEINIPHIFEMWTYYNVYGLKDHAMYMMREYLKKGGKTFADCKQCGLCEKKCPQHLEIRKNLEKVCEILCEGEK